MEDSILDQWKIHDRGKKFANVGRDLGRVNNGDPETEVFKGIFDVNINNVTIAPWNVTSFKLSSVTDNSFSVIKMIGQTRRLSHGPQFLVGHLDIVGQLLDTYLNTEGWGKGVAYVNGRNLGRYWTLGPQMTLYVPAAYLKSGRNNLVLLEFEKVPEDKKIGFQTLPIWITNLTSLIRQVTVRFKQFSIVYL